MTPGEPLPDETTSTEQFADVNVTFSLNVQDFAYPDRSAELVERVVDLHEALGVPVDIYLTSTITDLYQEIAPDLLERLRTSPVVAVSYHVRAPAPYYNDYDWAALGDLAPEEQYARIMEYETHGLDLVTGEPNAAAGGYSELAEIMGYPPYSAGALSDANLVDSVQSVFRDLGARFTIRHDTATDPGTRSNGLYLKPEHHDLKLFQLIDEADADIWAEATAPAAPGNPWFVGVKMHDNDFFAVDSAWVTTYTTGSRRPPWDLEAKSPLLAPADQDAMWAKYESFVRFVASVPGEVAMLNLPGVLARLDSAAAPATTMAAASATTAAASPGACPEGATRLYVAGTMHIESNAARWESDPDALLDFLAQVTHTGMRFSIGPDVGWLRNDPEAPRIVAEATAMGVEWDVHTHELADKAAAISLLESYGVQPTTVVNGLTIAELAPLADLVIPDWSAETLFGVTMRPDHSEGSEDFTAGVWRPALDDFTADDPAGPYVHVGGGTRSVAGAAAVLETLAQHPAGSVVSTAIMIDPQSLLTPTGEAEGIEEIVEFMAGATRSGCVVWATIAETADAWLAAGAVDSRLG